MLSFLGKEWIFRSQNFMTQKQGISDILSRILTGRGIADNAISDFLNPTIRKLLPDPNSLTDMDKAVERTVAAIKNKESITIYGDYDVDGVTSTSLLIRFFRHLEISVSYYIPDRLTEGYGLNSKALKQISQTSSLVIAVDCGTVSVNEIEEANIQGLSTIILDHHQIGQTLPNTIVVNPNRDSNFSEILCAAGIVFLFLVALNARLRREMADQPLPNLMEFLDFVALGTVCDVMPLLGINRAFVKRGLEQMNLNKNLGLTQLKQVAQISSDISSYHLGFAIGPRINAGGRVGTSLLGTKLLTSLNEKEAATLATQLHLFNEERQALEKQILQEAKEQIKDSQDPVIFVGNQDWHPGVIGIVASRLRETYNRPAFIYSIEKDGIAKGSCRSVEGFDIGQIIHKAVKEGRLTGGGGHTMAAGFSFLANKAESLKTFLCEQACGFMKKYKPTLWIDTSLSLSGVTSTLFNELMKMEPFGTCNPEPVFCFHSVIPSYARIVGQDHISCILTNESGCKIRAIAFKCGDNPLGQALLSGQRLDIAGTLHQNVWQGQTSLQIQIKDGTRIS